MTTELVFRIPKSLWMSANAPLHWADAAKRKRGLRQLGKAVAQTKRTGPLGTVHIAAYIGYPRGAGKADPANERVTKHLIDGIVDAGLLVDDDSTHVLGPTFLRDPGTNERGVWSVRLVLAEGEVPW